jgi:SOS-response transcriptional repressor LexA
MGFPNAAEEELLDTMSLEEFLIENKEATFLLRVKGDAMVEAGILEGDIVLVERGKTPKPSSIVIALIENEYAMKFFNKIEKKGEVKIEAVVRAVIRKY